MREEEQAPPPEKNTCRHPSKTITHPLYGPSDKIQYGNQALKKKMPFIHCTRVQADVNSKRGRCESNRAFTIQESLTRPSYPTPSSPEQQKCPFSPITKVTSSATINPIHSNLTYRAGGPSKSISHMTRYNFVTPTNPIQIHSLLSH